MGEMIIYIAMYLVAIILANLSINHFGADVSILNAFLFIGLDLTIRDRLHDLWKGKWRLGLNLALITSGGILSYLLNAGLARIAIASSLSFLASGIIDFSIYLILEKQNRFYRVNISNIFSALTDSVLFPLIAFGYPLMLGIMIGQFIAKTIGGYIWYLILNRK